MKKAIRQALAGILAALLLFGALAVGVSAVDEEEELAFSEVIQEDELALAEVAASAVAGDPDEPVPTPAELEAMSKMLAKSANLVSIGWNWIFLAWHAEIWSGWNLYPDAKDNFIVNALGYFVKIFIFNWWVKDVPNFLDFSQVWAKYGIENSWDNLRQAEDGTQYDLELYKLYRAGKLKAFAKDYEGLARKNLYHVLQFWVVWCIELNMMTSSLQGTCVLL